jgi:hypothetical protein
VEGSSYGDVISQGASRFSESRVTIQFILSPYFKFGNLTQNRAR